MPTHVPLDWQALDQLVVSLPVHVLYFDGGLICRYAAPAGPHLLGQPASALLGMPAAAIFPAEMDMVPGLQQVLTTQQPWRSEQVAYPAGPQADWPAGNWQVQARPWTLGEAPHGSGVLLSCLPCRDAAAAEALTAEGERAAVLLESIRTQLTVIRGFAGLLNRRGPTDAQTQQALHQVERAAVTLTDLVQQYEASTHLQVHYPDQPAS